MRILIDGDPIVYRTGFAAQNEWKILRWSDVVKDDDPDQDIERERAFIYVWEMEDFIERNNLHPDEYQVTKWIDPLPVEFALKITKDAVQNVADAVEGYLAEEDGYDPNDIQVEVYLSGTTNFRNALATIVGSYTKDGEPVLGYKANRRDNRRPHWYARIREYLVEQWDAKLIEGIEADDALAIEQWADDEYNPQTIIATLDKDLKNVPGWHYNLLKKTDCLISRQDARVFFYRQCLMGDRTDNIPGLWRVGEGKAAQIITDDMDEKQMYTAVLEAYEANMEKFPEKYPDGMTAEAALLENARLLWMLQHEDQLWTPPGQKDESIEDLGLLDEEEEV